MGGGVDKNEQKRGSANDSAKLGSPANQQISTVRFTGSGDQMDSDFIYGRPQKAINLDKMRQTGVTNKNVTFYKNKMCHG